MKAYWLDDNAPISAQELKVHGVDYAKLDLHDFQADLERIKATNGYVTQDIRIKARDSKFGGHLG